MPIDTATNFAVNPTRSAGLEHLRAFLPNAGRRYATDRNSDYGPNNRSNVSTLSGHLRHRLILETEVLEAVLGRYAQSTADKFIQELFWRGWGSRQVTSSTRDASVIQDAVDKILKQYPPK